MSSGVDGIHAIILAYFPERLQNMPTVIAKLMASTLPPARITVVCNNPAITLTAAMCDKRGAPVDVCNAGRNYGCQVRHALGLLSPYRHLLFVDDDVIAPPDTIKTMRAAAGRWPNTVIGVKGRISPASTSVYTQMEVVTHVKEPTPVDIVVGVMHMCTRRNLVAAFNACCEPQIPAIFREDDIVLSMANGGGIVVPAQLTFKEHGTGLSYQRDHCKDRNAVVVAMREVIAGGFKIPPRPSV